MNRITLAAAPALWVALIGPGAAPAGDRSLSVTTRGVIRSCDDLEIRFGGERRPLEIGRSTRLLPPRRGGSADRLAIEVPQGGGIIVEPSASGSYEATACVAAGARRLQDAESLLARISVEWSGDRLAVEGPGPEEEDDWVVYLLVRAPQDAVLDLSAENGPIDLREVSGTIQSRNLNGPTSASDCAGAIDIGSRNGPVSVRGGAGRLRVQVDNGPISIELDGTGWRGEGLDAHTRNGPVSLSVPGDYGSGVRVEASWHSPFDCDAQACDDARRTWDDESRVVRLGSGKTQVRVSTVNGPVSIHSARRRGESL